VGCTAAPTPSPSNTTSADIAAPVDVGGGRTLYLECHGTGSPTVVLLSGFGNAADIWQVASSHPPPVATGVAGFTRVCSYDRPGSYVTTVERNGRRVEATADDQYRGARGNAVASTTPGGGAPIVAELHHLLEVAGVRAPYVLVGHSLGGVFTLLYARTYPEQMAGMVLVDSPTPNVRALLSPQWAVLAFAPQSDPGPSLVPGYVNERYQVARIFEEIDAAGPLPRVPLTYLQATIPLDLDQVPADQRPSSRRSSRRTRSPRPPTWRPSRAPGWSGSRTRRTSADGETRRGHRRDQGGRRRVDDDDDPDCDMTCDMTSRRGRGSECASECTRVVLTTPSAL
jgi:pimeloyl-ACP methyl ester carboxylesterase